MSGFEQQLARFLRVAPQRWILAAAAVIAATAASLVAGMSGGGQSILVFILVVGFAVGSVARPATHTALAVMIVVTWQWLVTTDDRMSPLVIGVACLLFAFHTIVALLATVPITAGVEAAIGRRWGRRSALVVIATVAMWLAVALMDQRRADGSVALTLLGFVTVTVLVLGLGTRRRTIGNRQPFS
jgi:hypothetical protein